MGQFVITPESRTESFLELSRSPKGTLFKKHILSKGPLFANGRKIDVDDEFFDSVVKNFHDKRCDIVQVPIVGKDNQHSEDPRDNIGEVVDLQVENGKLYSIIDSRKDDATKELGNTLIGASAMFSTDYPDTDTNTRVGPTLLHVAITNRPHVLNLEDFEPVVALSGSDDEVIMLSETSEDSTVDTNELEETQNMTLEQLLASLKDDHGIDVEDLKAKAEKSEGLETTVADLTSERDTLATEKESLETEKAETEELAVKLSASIKEHLKTEGILKLSADSSGLEQVETLIGAVAEAGSELVNLSGRIESLETDKKVTAATSEVDELIASGRVLPVHKEAMVELRLSNKEIFDKIVPETPLVALSAENGTSSEPEGLDPEANVSSEVKRIMGIS